jgi:peptidoglycan/LPS O-acetylase OafA/YrhL
MTIKKIDDTLALILTALAVSGIIILFMVFVRPRFSEEWAKFIYTSVGYLVMLIYMVYTFEPFKRLPKWKLLLFQVIFYVLTVGIAFLVFNSGLLPLPKGGFTYVAPGVALTVLSLIVLEYLRKRLRFFKK